MKNMSDQPQDNNGAYRCLIVSLLLIGFSFVLMPMGKKLQAEAEEMQKEIQARNALIMARIEYEETQVEGIHLFSGDWNDRYVRISSEDTDKIEFVDVETGVVYLYSEEVVEGELKNALWRLDVNPDGSARMYDGDLEELKESIPEDVVYTSEGK